jgi:hypothetical protein
MEDDLKKIEDDFKKGRRPKKKEDDLTIFFLISKINLKNKKFQK